MFGDSLSVNLWDKNVFSEKPKYILLLGVLFLVVMAFSRMVADDIGGKAGLVMTVFGIGILAVYGGSLRRSFVIKLFFIAVLIQLASWGLSHLYHPEWAERSPKLSRLSPWFMMVPIALFLGGSTKNTLIIWAVALAGIILSPWLSGGGWFEIERGLQGERVDFNINNAQHTAMLFGTSLIGLITLSGRFFEGPIRSKWWRSVLWLFLVAVCLTGVVITQTRAIWLGLLATSIVCLLLGAMWITLSKSTLLKNWRMWLVVTLVLLGGLGLSVNFKGVVEHRIAAETKTITQLIEGQEDFYALDSVGLRVATWIEAIEWIEERPLFGWGGKGRKLVVQHTDKLPESVKKQFGHLHNSYLDTLVNYGFVGLLLLFALLGLLAYAAKYAWGKQVLPTDMLLFFVSLLIFWLVINLFESYMFYSSGVFVFGLVAGAVLTHYWKALLVSNCTP